MLNNFFLSPRPPILPFPLYLLWKVNNSVMKAVTVLKHKRENSQ